MKIFLILMTAFLVQVSASTFAQKITLNEKRASLISIFEKINKQSGIDFLLNIELLNDAKPVSINANNEELAIVLEKIFDGQPLDYEIKDKAVLVSKKTPSILERIANRWASIDIFGRVVDAENRPLAGATVKIKSTGKSVLTDANGKFTVARIEEGTVLVVSYTGYVSKEVPSSLNMGNIILEPSLSKLDEVQVIAYGTTTQRLSTGNVTTIKADVIEKQPVNNPLLALQGRVPGLFIEQATGFAGTGVKVRIQGTNSIQKGNDPLYVIDGIPYSSQLLPGGNEILNGSARLGDNGAGSPLNFINPLDIESIDVLKDADATSIYGSRAANGAILITTKKGKAGDTRISINIQQGIGKVTRKLDLMNRDQYIEMINEGFKNDGIDLNSEPYNTDLYKSQLYPDISGFWDNTRYTDWQKELLGGSAKYTNMQVSFSGGNSLTTYLLGGNYHRETNVFLGDYADAKGSAHFNLNSSSANQKFKIQFSGSYLNDNNSLPGEDLTATALYLPPVAPKLFEPDGGLNWMTDATGVSTFFNPLQYLSKTFQNNTTNIIGNGIFGYEIAKGFEFRTSLGYNNLNSEIIYAQPSLQPEEQHNISRWPTLFSSQKITSSLIEPLLSYANNFSFGKLEFLLGSTYQQKNSKASSINGSGFSSVQVMRDIKAATVLTPSSSIQEVYKYNAFFSRINYNLMDKYIFNLSARRDGSSRFGAENKFHNFWALGAAWIFSKEKLFEEEISFLSFGKLRGSYGTTGNDQIGEYKFLSLYNSVNYPVPYQGVNGYTPIGLSNPYLQWEETKKVQFGIDLGFLNDRIFLTTNYSLNKSSNQLMNLSIPIQTGFSNLSTNFSAEVQNSGWEFSLTTINLIDNNLKWHSNFNLTVQKNKLLKFSKLIDFGYSSFYSIGKSINLQHLYHYLGVDPLTGVYQVADRNGQPTTNPIPYFLPNTDATILLDTDPKFYGGFQNSLSYKGLQLDIMFYFNKQASQNYSFGYPLPAGNPKIEQPVSQVSRWQNPGDIAKAQRYTSGFDLYLPLQNAQMYSDAGWTNNYYIRLKNLSLSWQMPEKINKKMHFDNCKIYLQGQNLLTFTNYTGLDPETKSSSSLPPLRILTLGIQIGI